MKIRHFVFASLLSVFAASCIFESGTNISEIKSDSKVFNELITTMDSLNSEIQSADKNSLPILTLKVVEVKRKYESAKDSLNNKEQDYFKKSLESVVKELDKKSKGFYGY